jgi:phenylalanyl-tRNA synthetase alpha chain
MASELESTLRGLQTQALGLLEQTGDLAGVEELRVRLLGRKGELTAALKGMGALAPEERPVVGKVANEVKDAITAALDAKLAALKAAAAGTAVGIDVTLPGRRRPLGLKHPLSRTVDDCVACFRRMGFVVADGPDIEDEYHNFDALNTPADHPSRDIQDTFYLPDGRLLRTQTSPVQIRVMLRQPPPVRIICPGSCYRRDTPDATHSMHFRQIEGLYVDKQVSLADLKGTLLTFAREIFGEEVKIRLRPHFFPFTEPSIECDVSFARGKGGGERWLEIAGAGMVDPNVLTAVGYDPEEVSGYAFGMGIERIAMIRYGITDIRLLYENDVRFLTQF